MVPAKFSAFTIWLTTNVLTVQSTSNANDEGRVYTRSSVTGLLRGSVAIECSYKPANEWVLMRWRRIAPNTNKGHVIATVIRNSGNNAVYTDPRHARYDSRIAAGSTTNGSHVRFFLGISGLLCADAGTYDCDVSTIFKDVSSKINVSVQAYPDKPHIKYDVLVVEHGETTTLSCVGNVGYPPGSLQWYMRTPERDYFRVMDTQDMTLTSDPENCSFKATSYLNITMSDSLNGVCFRCAINSVFTSPADSKFYDEVTIKLPTIPPDSRMDQIEKLLPTYSIAEIQEFHRSPGASSASTISTPHVYNLITMCGVLSLTKNFLHTMIPSEHV